MFVKIEVGEIVVGLARTRAVWITMAFDTYIVLEVMFDAERFDETVTFPADALPVVDVVEVKMVMFATGVVKDVVAVRVSTFAPPRTFNFPLEFTPPFTVSA